MASRRNPTEGGRSYASDDLSNRIENAGMVNPGAGRNRQAERNMDSTEKNYVKGAGKRDSAYEAVRRARRANRKPSVDD